MEKNIGKIDRIVRFLLGIFLIYLAFTLNNRIGIVLTAALGAISILESFTGFCGLYKLLNIKTRR